MPEIISRREYIHFPGRGGRTYSGSRGQCSEEIRELTMLDFPGSDINIDDDGWIKATAGKN